MRDLASLTGPELLWKRCSLTRHLAKGEGQVSLLTMSPEDNSTNLTEAHSAESLRSGER